MKRRRSIRRRWLLGGAFLLASVASWGASTVNETWRYSYAANAGWMDWYADGTNGAVFTSTIASGSVWGANFGWISLGDGTPDSGPQYSNATSSDFGVNVDAVTDPHFFVLSGYAYSANAGWISFDAPDPSDPPRIEKNTGLLRGSIYGANIGWISLFTTESAVLTGLTRNSARASWVLYE